MGRIFIKRIYDGWEEQDGFRVLVDRIWPRGISKDEAHIDYWAKDLAVASDLRKWFGYDPEKWDEFRERYLEDLRANEGAGEALLAKAGKKRLTLVYAAHDVEHNNAVVLKEYLEKWLKAKNRSKKEIE